MIQYQIFELRFQDVCTPSRDYYARGNDWSSTRMMNLIPQGTIENTMEDTLKHLEGLVGEFVILPIVLKTK